MFHIGLFSTFIPYLLFAIAYIGLLGTNALNKNQYIDCPDLLSKYEIPFIDEYCEASFFYSNNDKELISSNYKTIHANKVHLKEINSHTKIKYFDKFDTINKFINGSIFIRPPPPINA